MPFQQSVEQQRIEERNKARRETEWNVKGLRGKTREHPLGSFSVDLGKGVSRQYYDVRYNLHVCKSIIKKWKRNAYNGDSIKINVGGRDCYVHCHIDITTPREDFLWHGDVEGPHIVIESYELTRGRPQKLADNCIWLSPDDIFQLYIHMENGKDGWPRCITAKLVNNVTIGIDTIEKKKNRQVADSDSEEEGGLGLLF